jgi:hypothetical protein
MTRAWRESPAFGAFQEWDGTVAATAGGRVPLPAPRRWIAKGDPLRAVSANRAFTLILTLGLASARFVSFASIGDIAAARGRRRLHRAAKYTPGGTADGPAR